MQHDEERRQQFRDVRVPSYGILDSETAAGIAAGTASAAVDSQHSASVTNGFATVNGDSACASGSFAGMAQGKRGKLLKRT